MSLSQFIGTDELDDGIISFTFSQIFVRKWFVFSFNKCDPLFISHCVKKNSQIYQSFVNPFRIYVSHLLPITFLMGSSTNNNIIARSISITTFVWHYSRSSTKTASHSTPQQVVVVAGSLKKNGNSTSVIDSEILKLINVSSFEGKSARVK